MYLNAIFFFFGNRFSHYVTFPPHISERFEEIKLGQIHVDGRSQHPNYP